MSTFNIRAFRDYVRSLIGDQTQKDFARRVGMTPEHLSRMLKSKNPSRPSRTSLAKLSRGNETAYAEMLELCGYVQNDYSHAPCWPWPVREPDKEMTATEYQRLAAHTINPALTEAETEAHALYGMAAEVGELLGLYQKRLQGHMLDPEHAKKKCGDIFWMLAEYCTVTDWSMSDVMQMNIEKLKKNYPDGFDADHNMHRTEGDV